MLLRSFTWPLVATIAISFVSAALPQLGPVVDRWVKDAEGLDLMVASSNPYIRFDTSQAFYAYVRNYGRWHLDNGMTELELFGHVRTYAEHQRIKEKYIADVLDKVDHTGQISVQDANSKWLLRNLIRHYNLAHS